jgi:hypothetical protein
MCLSESTETARREWMKQREALIAKFAELFKGSDFTSASLESAGWHQREDIWVRRMLDSDIPVHVDFELFLEEPARNLWTVEAKVQSHVERRVSSRLRRHIDEFIGEYREECFDVEPAGKESATESESKEQ